MYLPLINVFDSPYQIWKNEPSAIDKILARFEKRTLPPKQLVKSICNHFDAASHILEKGMDNGLEFHIDSYLRSSRACNSWHSQIPNQIPKPLYDYKNLYPKYNIAQVDEVINSLDMYLSEDQTLFHGGLFDDFGEYPTNKPLSASFCPQVALRNAEWRGKAYDRGQIDIFVLKVKAPSSKVFFYNLEDKLGNEKEVLFASGAQLRFIRRTQIRDDYCVGKINSDLQEFEKIIPVYVVEAEIS